MRGVCRISTKRARGGSPTGPWGFFIGRLGAGRLACGFRGRTGGCIGDGSRWSGCPCRRREDSDRIACVVGCIKERMIMLKKSIISNNRVIYFPGDSVVLPDEQILKDLQIFLSFFLNLISLHLFLLAGYWMDCITIFLHCS